MFTKTYACIKTVPVIKPPNQRYEGPSSFAKDSTVDRPVYLPTPYSIRHIGMDQMKRKRTQTIRNTSAPANTILLVPNEHDKETTKCVEISYLSFIIC